MTEQTTENKIEQFKLFDMYDVASIEIKDPAMRHYICLTPKLLLKNQGRQTDKLRSTKVNVVERLALRLAVPGHMGKEHKIITSWSSGNYTKNMNTVLKTLKIIQDKTGSNPVQVLVQAIEKASPRDEITVIESGGARYPQAVDTSPLRRVNLAIRWFVQGAFRKAHGKKTKMADALANEIMLASKENMESFAYSRKNEAERQADGAR
ncbi:MAG: 30S ribosomal protein S7 [Nanoarchaeota archaeon]|nr:30S ribosomal protein S7 [Nanoarchaeota archaeon]